MTNSLRTLIVATPMRSGDMRTGHVTSGYSDFVVELVKRGASTVNDILPDDVVSSDPKHPDWIYGGKYSYNTDVVRGRNRIVGRILRDRKDATGVLWVDDDQWPETLDVVDDLIATGEPMVAAPYTNKSPPVRFVFQHWQPEGMPDPRGIVDIRGCGFGFVYTSVECLQRMADVSRWYTDLPTTDKVPDVFDMVYDKYGEYDVKLSEDYSFCKRWREQCGGRVKLLTKGVIYHAGSHGWSARNIPGAVVG